MNEESWKNEIKNVMLGCCSKYYNHRKMSNNNADRSYKFITKTLSDCLSNCILHVGSK